MASFRWDAYLVSSIHTGPDPTLTFFQCGEKHSIGQGQSKTIICDDLQGRYVYVWIPGSKKILTLCEVSVHATDHNHYTYELEASTKLREFRFWNENNIRGVDISYSDDGSSYTLAGSHEMLRGKAAGTPVIQQSNHPALHCVLLPFCLVQCILHCVPTRVCGVPALFDHHPRPSENPWIHCASEGGTCSFSGIT